MLWSEVLYMLWTVQINARNVTMYGSSVVWWYVEWLDGWWMVDSSMVDGGSVMVWWMLVWWYGEWLDGGMVDVDSGMVDVGMVEDSIVLW